MSGSALARWAVPVLLAVSALAHGQMVAVGQQAPALKVTELKGAPFDLAALRGQVVIVNFWATWCSPCRAEMPALDAFYQRYRGRGLTLLGLSIDDLSDRGQVLQVMQRFHYPAGLMAQAKENGFGAPLAVPITYVVDASGVIRQRILPGKHVITEQLLAKMVLPLLPHRKR